MFIFQHRQIVKDMGGYNCVAICNPSDKIFRISRIQADVSFTMDIAVVVVPLESFTDYAELDTVQSSLIGEQTKTNARFYNEIAVQDNWTVLKFSTLQTAMPFDIISPSDNLNLPKGYGIMIRAKPWDPNKYINVTINYKEE